MTGASLSILDLSVFGVSLVDIRVDDLPVVPQSQSNIVVDGKYDLPMAHWLILWVMKAFK